LFHLKRIMKEFGPSWAFYFRHYQTLGARLMNTRTQTLCTGVARFS
jgi:hypothetical protein